MKTIEGFVVGMIIAVFDILWRLRRPSARGVSILVGWAIGAMVGATVAYLVFETLLGFNKLPGGLGFIFAIAGGYVAVLLAYLVARRARSR